MVYIDQSGAEIESVDLTLGRLEDAEWIDHPAIPATGHYEYETLKGGGRLQRFVEETPFQPARREVTKQRYIPYSEAELQEIAAGDYAGRLNVLEAQTQNHEILLKAIEEGIADA